MTRRPRWIARVAPVAAGVLAALVLMVTALALSIAPWFLWQLRRWIGLG